MSYNLSDFSMDLRKSMTPPNHVWLNSGYSTCAPDLYSVMGVRGCYSPPFVAGNFALNFNLVANSHTITDIYDTDIEDLLLYSGGEWNPDKIIRKGTYHRYVNDELISFSAVSELTSLFGQSGFSLKINIRNRSDKPLKLIIDPVVTPGNPTILPLNSWWFIVPKETTDKAIEIKKDIWENNEARVTLLSKNSACQLEKGVEQTYYFSAVFTKAQEAVKEPYDFTLWHESGTKAWENRIELLNNKFPSVKSNIPGLENYYMRSVISGLVCLWENDDFVLNPFPATCGMEGGGICCYLWDTGGYSAQAIVMLLGDKVFDLIRLFIKNDIGKYYAISPGGGGVGVSYSYSMWSVMNLYWSAITYFGVGFELFDDIKDLFLREESRLEEWENLKNYGNQHNLLEMRTSGYEYYTPSPNAERALCYNRLAEIAEYIGKKETADWHEKARLIKQSILDNLWENNEKWFKSVRPGFEVEMVYSIQAYDALRAGVCNDNMKNALLSQLKDGAFLGKYGVSSVSALDEEHYELNDPDWSGGGSYIGDGPVLAQTLWEIGETELAWDILKRHFWMGEMLIYYPQEYYCDRPSLPAHKRANEISGITGAQAIIFGIGGITPTLDGTLIIDPNPPKDGFIEIKGFIFKNSIIDFMIKPGYMEVKLNGKTEYEGVPKEIRLKR